ncbi:unnamed protein product, partial [Pylaiella littoralis]
MRTSVLLCSSLADLFALAIALFFMLCLCDGVRRRFPRTGLHLSFAIIVVFYICADLCAYKRPAVYLHSLYESLVCHFAARGKGGVWGVKRVLVLYFSCAGASPLCFRYLR